MPQNDTQACQCSCSPGTSCDCTGCRCTHHGQRPLHVIAGEIRKDWSAQGRGVSPYAQPYLDALDDLNSPYDNYGADSASSIVRYFLANANTWRGPKAREIKAELRSMVEGVY